MQMWPGMAVTHDALSQCIVELRKAFHDNSRRSARSSRRFRGSVSASSLRSRSRQLLLQRRRRQHLRASRPSRSTSTRPRERKFARVLRLAASPNAALVALVIAAARQRRVLVERKVPSAVAGSARSSGLHQRDRLHRFGGARHDLARWATRRLPLRSRWCVGCLREPDRHRRLPEPHPRPVPRVAQSCRADARLLADGSEVTDLVDQEPQLEHPRGLAGFTSRTLRASPSSTGLDGEWVVYHPSHRAIRCSSAAPMRSLGAKDLRGAIRHPLPLPHVVS